MSSTVNPTSTATNLATAYMQPMQTQLSNEMTTASNTASALTTLQTALSTFDSALTTLSGSGTSGGSGVTAYSATFSNPAIGTATASSSATPGTYSFYVQQLATAQQTVYANLSSVPAAGAGTLTLDIANGNSFSVNLSTAGTSGSGSLSASDIASAINQASGNNGAVVASVVTVGSQTELLLSAGQTGADNAITLDTSGITNSTLQSALSGGQQLSAAQNAIVYLGGQGGVALQQDSNTFTSVAGVSINFTQAQSATDAPVTLTVASDASATASNVQTFVSAYNTVQSALSALTADGNAATGAAPGIFANDPGVEDLENQLNQFVRQDFNGQSLIGLGVSADQNGVLSLNQTTLTQALTANPAAVGDVFGNAGLINNTCMLGSINTYLQSWLTPDIGQIAERQSSVQAQQKSLQNSQTQLTTQYNDLYQRYLTQFTNLQSLQAQMSQTESLYFSSSSSTSSSSSSSSTGL
ncbi:MAG: flagellar filament capping protein FliD [Steroidobacteraceae bacterium]